MKCSHPEVNKMSHAIDLLDGTRLWLCDACFKHLSNKLVSYVVRDTISSYGFEQKAREFFSAVFADSIEKGLVSDDSSGTDRE